MKELTGDRHRADWLLGAAVAGTRSGQGVAAYAQVPLTASGFVVLVAEPFLHHRNAQVATLRQAFFFGGC